jgi:hypothetical protein
MDIYVSLIPVPEGEELQGPPFPVRVADSQQVLEPEGANGAEPTNLIVFSVAEMERICWWKRHWE